MITRPELLSQTMTIVADPLQDKLVPECERLAPPDDYQPDGLLAPDRARHWAQYLGLLRPEIAELVARVD